MVRMTSFILSLACLATGFMGITGLLPIFITYSVLANLGAIVLGILGLLILIYAGRGGETARERREHSQQKEENEQLRKETFDQLKREIERLRKENEEQRNMIEQQSFQNSGEKGI